jgi:hypothetical protein
MAISPAMSAYSKVSIPDSSLTKFLIADIPISLGYVVVVPTSLLLDFEVTLRVKASSQET